MNPYIVFSAVLALGLRGIKNQIELTRPPISTKGLKDGSASSEVNTTPFLSTSHSNPRKVC